MAGLPLAHVAGPVFVQRAACTASYPVDILVTLRRVLSKVDACSEHAAYVSMPLIETLVDDGFYKRQNLFGQEWMSHPMNAGMSTTVNWISECLKHKMKGDAHKKRSTLNTRTQYDLRGLLKCHGLMGAQWNVGCAIDCVILLP